MDNRGAGVGADYRARRAPGGSSGAGIPRASVGDSISAILTSAKQALSDLFELIALEVKRAGLTLMWMLVWGVVALLMGVTAWFGLMVAIVLGLVAVNVPDVVAVLIVVALNLVGAGAIAFWCKSATRDLAMPATRRQLKLAAAEASEVSLT